ncbi:MAG: hypothetical protein ACRD0Z_08045 [Acidimicrobiales bacterium]
MVVASSVPEAVRALVARPDRRLGGTLRVAAALLLRQCLEDDLSAFWVMAEPGMERVSHRAQLISLPFYVEEGLGRRAAAAWSQLSAICHHDAYELAPSVEEVRRLADVVEELSVAVTISPAAGAATAGTQAAI